jgi:hypothetical protein
LPYFLSPFTFLHHSIIYTHKVRFENLPAQNAL